MLTLELVCPQSLLPIISTVDINSFLLLPFISSLLEVDTVFELQRRSRIDLVFLFSSWPSLIPRLAMQWFRREGYCLDLLLLDEARSI